MTVSCRSRFRWAKSLTGDSAGFHAGRPLVTRGALPGRPADRRGDHRRHAAMRARTARLAFACVDRRAFGVAGCVSRRRLRSPSPT